MKTHKNPNRWSPHLCRRSIQQQSSHCPYATETTDVDGRIKTDQVLAAETLRQKPWCINYHQLQGGHKNPAINEVKWGPR